MNGEAWNLEPGTWNLEPWNPGTLEQPPAVTVGISAPDDPVRIYNTLRLEPLNSAAFEPLNGVALEPPAATVGISAPDDPVRIYNMLRLER